MQQQGITRWVSKPGGVAVLQRRDDTRCEVITTSTKHLSRPKGAKPGQVRVARETVVVGNPQRAPAFIETQTEGATGQ